MTCEDGIGDETALNMKEVSATKLCSHMHSQATVNLHSKLIGETQDLKNYSTHKVE
jgi:hypothetical protein